MQSDYFFRNFEYYLPRDVFGFVRFSRLTTGEKQPESAAEESRDALFLRFSSFPPFIRAPVVVPRLVSWFLLCHTRPYTYIHRGSSFYTGLWVGLYYGLGFLFLSLSLPLFLSLRSSVTLRRVAGTINLRLLRR